jgi:hypothetical protein
MTHTASPGLICTHHGKSECNKAPQRPGGSGRWPAKKFSELDVANGQLEAQ